MNSNSNEDATLLSIVVPAYNEEDVLVEFHRRLSAVLDGMGVRSEIVYVNDGSRDSTLDILHSLKEHDERVAILDLSRNFGKEIALTAGLDHTQGDAVVVIDADLQDPPELITTLYEHWKQGFDTVYAKRMKRDGESILKKTTSFLFYRLMQSIGRVKIPEDTGDFRILSRRAVEALNELREQHRFMKGLFTWIGFSQKAIPYERDSRFAGETKWNYWRLWNLALEGITSFTTVPLSYATYTGFITAFFSMLYGFYMIIRTVFFGNPVPGYPSLMVTVLFLGGIQLFAIGIVGEYLGRVFNETKGRPLYFVNEYIPAYKLNINETISPKSESVNNV
ncbi:MAG: glycosyltransferase family 2 protein [Candidatus Thiodiazotropha sp.]